jgi:3-keto-5-aminohexanoate cleavage enzyme
MMAITTTRVIRPELTMTDKAIITCALTGVLTDPKQHPVPVTPEEMAREAKAAFDAGAAIMHVHFRQQGPGMGHLPSWEPKVAITIMQAIQDACPGVILNQSTGTIGKDIAGPLACLEAVKPEIAACNAGSLNYLKVKADGSWAWPPRLFDNPVEKVRAYLEAMAKTRTRPEFECFDTGIVRCVEMYVRNGMYAGRPQYNFVMGVESGMPADPALLPILRELVIEGCAWQVTAIGRAGIWPLHARAAELGGHLRTGLEDTFYLPDGGKARSNGELVAALAGCARAAGRAIATPVEARDILGLRDRAAPPLSGPS